MNIQRVSNCGTICIKFTDDDGKVIEIVPIRDASDMAQAILFEQQDIEQEEAHAG